MMRADRFLSDDDKSAVEEAIEEAERRTAAEIVCAVATESDRYDRGESLAGLGFGLVMLGVLYGLYGGLLADRGSWDATPEVPFMWAIAAVVGGFLVGSVVASYWHGLRRMLVSPEHLTSAVERAAWRLFGMKKIRSTEQRAGLLIYVSLFERRVSVLADDAALEVLGEDGIEHLKQTAVEHLVEGHTAQTFIDTVTEAADRLADDIPPGEANPDELADRVLVFHPRIDG